MTIATRTIITMRKNIPVIKLPNCGEREDTNATTTNKPTIPIAISSKSLLAIKIPPKKIS